MGYRNIKARQRNRGDDTNVSGKNEQYHTYKDAKVGKFVNFSINSYDVDGANPTVTTGLQLTADTLYKIDTAGYHVMTCLNPSPVNVEMWAWGAGGGGQGVPAPGGGAAGGGVYGIYEMSPGQVFTILVGENGEQYPGSGPGAEAFPDGGWAASPGGGGGGSSRIGSGTIPYPTRNTPTTNYLLIGGGGGGGGAYLTAGTVDGMGGYPSGFPGGAYYPSDPSSFGGGGTQSAGGAAGPAGRQPAGTAGDKYFGGPGGPGGGGGGGGGYYGGGGAGGYYANGGGGSGFIDPTITSARSFTALPGWPQSSQAIADPLYPTVKPAAAGNLDSPGVVVLRVVS